MPLGLAAALAMVLVVRTPDAPDGIPLKAPLLGVWVQRSGTQSATPWDGAPLRPGDQLQATLMLAAAAHGAVWAKDPSGELARVFPSEATPAAGALAAGPARGVGPSIRIPERSGVLELIAIVQEQPMDVAAVEGALRERSPTSLGAHVLRIPFEDRP